MTKYIAIDGSGGAGKTYLSDLLATALNASVLHLDEYGDDFKPFIGVPKLKEELLGVNAEYVIFEGVGVFGDDLESFNAYKIFVDTPEHIRRSRVALRDVPRHDRSQADWEEIFKIWNEAEESYFTENIKNKADLVVGQDGDFDIDTIAAECKQYFGGFIDGNLT